MAVHHDLRRTGLLADDGQGVLEFAVVAGQVGGEVRSLAGSPRPPTFVQVERGSMSENGITFTVSKCLLNRLEASNG